MLRATYADGTDSYVVTVGVAVLPSTAQAAGGERVAVRPPTRSAGSSPACARWRSRTPPAAWFTDQRRQLSGSFRAGTYVALYTVGYADSRPREPVSGDSYADGEMTSVGSGVAQAVLAAVGAPVPAAALPGDARMLSAGARPRWRAAAGRPGGRALAGVALAGLLAVATSLPAAAAPADSVRDQQQWVLNMLDVPSAWSVSEGANVTVAVIDSGVNPDVSDLTGAVTTGSDFTDLSTSSSNPHWGQHGTWMASIIAGRGNGVDDGIIGVAPEAKILSIRVIPDMNDPGYKKYDNEPEGQIQGELAEGIRQAVRDHAQVISMSIGYSAPSGAVRAALQYAYDHGIVLVASAGNSGDNDEHHTRAATTAGPRCRSRPSTPGC